MPVYGLEYIAQTSNFADFFGRLGALSQNIRGVFNGIIPVAVVRRDRDDEEGSLYAMTVETPGAVNQHSACVFGSAFSDFEVHGWAISWLSPATGSFEPNFHLFTPLSTYNPVVNINPVGIFTPGLITPHAFTFGTVGGIGGSNPALPTVQGLSLGRFTTSVTAGNWSRLGFDSNVFVDSSTPLRVYRDTTLAFQSVTKIAAFPLRMQVTLLYREQRRVSADPT